MRLGDLLREARGKLRAAGNELADLEARLLVSGVLDLSVSDVILKADEDVQLETAAQVLALADRRAEGVPVGRLLGWREFWGLRFDLNEATLEPRPDTEILVEAVLARSPSYQPLRMADIGTGTGAIAVSLLKELPQAVCDAVDLSQEALNCAAANAARHGVSDRFHPVCADYASMLSGGLDWLISNPPYIRSSVIAGLDRDVRDHDPVLALDGGEDGLRAYRILTRQAADLLKPGGRIGFEIGYDQGREVCDLLSSAGFLDIEIIQDLGAKDRVVLGRWPLNGPI
ncbi:peptide chain release factor N(5)-glutamine methyltransferase [Roseibium litorale]|uniref:Release factor glutamine methyltransferase n=1 Tax=Roseibium litorale TaxID=2803841 RepID=A0ABR9CMT6_9HYPH|nr:peptide chain release factor N(5)-glutamine methyltransferase [Roseibium litorale]MBD8891969.1 peptide chain release factor N(5)-glutamine methyltransferase [Roseibium litorale]